MCHILRKCVIIFHHKGILQFSYGKYLSFPGCRCLVRDLLAEVGLSATSALDALRPKLALARWYCKHVLERSSCLLDFCSTHRLSKCPPPSYSSAEQVQRRAKTNGKYLCAYLLHSSYSIAALTLLFDSPKLERERD